MNKLQEQASSKAELSYSFWAARAASEAPPPQPKKLTEEEAAAHQQQLKHTEHGASAWNYSGTFEERSVPLSWVQEQLREVLQGLQPSQAGVALTVTEVASCSGEAHQWIVRGKKRAGFELNFEFKWRAEMGGGAVVAGSAKVPHAAADELDELQLEVKLDDDAAAAAPAADGAAAVAATEEQRRQAKAAVSGMLPSLEGALEQLLERLKQK